MAEERVQRRLAAIMAADVVGYSRLMREDGTGTLAQLKVLRKEVFDPCTAEHSGRIVKTTGDGALVDSRARSMLLNAQSRSSDCLHGATRTCRKAIGLSSGLESTSAMSQSTAMTSMATPTPRQRHGSPRRLQPGIGQDQGERHLSEARGRSDRRRVRRASREPATANERGRI